MRFLRPTLRIRMALLYGGLVFLVGLSLLFTAVVLVRHALASLPFFSAPGTITVHDANGAVIHEVAPSELGAQAQKEAVNYLLGTGLLYFGIIVIIGATGGYLLARQALRPLAQLTRTARKMSTETLDQRIDLGGPHDELRELADTFDEMLARLNHAFDSQRMFVANASHELRTPLASLKALTETLRDGALEDPPAAERFLNSMETEIDALTQMVQELLELSRIESGQAALRLAPAAVAQIITPSVERLRPQAERNGLNLQVVIAEDTPPVLADVERMQQVVSNLVHNAIKFTPPGGSITVRAQQGRDGQIPASARKTRPLVSGGWPVVIVEVADTGMGIPARDLPRVFERFYKADRARGSGGAGLGLSIAHHLVEGHGGHIWVESEEGEGSTFFFSLPLAETSAHNPLNVL